MWVLAWRPEPVRDEIEAAQRSIAEQVRQIRLLAGLENPDPGPVAAERAKPALPSFAVAMARLYANWLILRRLPLPRLLSFGQDPLVLRWRAVNAIGPVIIQWSDHPGLQIEIDPATVPEQIAGRPHVPLQIFAPGCALADISLLQEDGRAWLNGQWEIHRLEEGGVVGAAIQGGAQ